MDPNQQEVLLEWLLSYELKLAARFRYYVALVYAKPKDQNGTKLEIEDMFENDMRDCDQYFRLQDNKWKFIMSILQIDTGCELKYA